MHISAIVPILLNIINSEHQRQQQAVEKQPFQAVLQEQPARPSPGAGPEGAEKTPFRPGAGESGTPVLVPLPLRSPLFPDTQFYVYHRQKQEPGHPGAGAGKGGETGIVFSLATSGLGRLFFMLTRRDDYIGITCHTQTRQAAERLKAGAGELTRQIRASGFGQVVFRCAVLDAKLARVPDGFTSPGLLDLKV